MRSRTEAIAVSCRGRATIASLLQAVALTLEGLVTPLDALGAEPTAEVVSVRKIWDGANHNAFTDLLWQSNRWLCVFREGKGHVSPDGAIRVLESRDGTDWHSVSLLQSSEADLRDPKLTLTPSGKLMLSAAAAYPAGATSRHQTFVWFSTNGSTWTEPKPVGDPNLWMWRINWHREVAWGIGYDTTGEKFIRLYRSDNGLEFTPHVPNLFDQEQPNEHGMAFLPNDTALCLLRRDGSPGHGLLGISSPPYRTWQWRDLGRKIGGPQIIRLPDGRLIAGARLYDGKVRMSILAVDPVAASLTELVALPSGGDCSYPGLVWHEGLLGVSYYSSHEGKTSIYFAKVRLGREK